MWHNFPSDPCWQHTNHQYVCEASLGHPVTDQSTDWPQTHERAQQKSAKPAQARRNTQKAHMIMSYIKWLLLLPLILGVIGYTAKANQNKTKKVFMSTPLWEVLYKVFYIDLLITSLLRPYDVDNFLPILHLRKLKLREVTHGQVREVVELGIGSEAKMDLPCQGGTCQGFV